MNRRLLTAGIAALVLGALYLIFSKNDEEVIAESFYEIIDALIITSHESGNARLWDSAGRAAKAASFTTEECSVKLAGSLHTVKNRKELTQLLAQIIHNTDRSDIEVRDLTVDVDEDSKSASVKFEAKATGTHSGRAYTVHNRYRTSWEKTDGDWLIRTIKIEEALHEG